MCISSPGTEFQASAALKYTLPEGGMGSAFPGFLSLVPWLLW